MRFNSNGNSAIVIVAALLFACMASTSPMRAAAQETLLTTEPLTVQEVTQSDGPVLAAGRVTSPLNTHVSPNINNDNLRDAIKRLMGKTDITYEIDSDVPNDVKVSLKAENILLSTAINVLTESAGIGCTESSKHTNTNTNGTHNDDSQVHLHFRKAPASPLGQGPSSWILNIPTTVFDKGAWKNNSLTLPNGLFNKSADGKNQFGTTFITPNGGGVDYTSKLFDSLKGSTTTINGVRPFLYDLKASEERSTFTCPHCHQQITVIKKHVAPKCPTCGKTFQDDWKFCPVDGTKRPEDSGDWKFCPHCGKAVSELTPSLLERSERSDPSDLSTRSSAAAGNLVWGELESYS